VLDKVDALGIVDAVLELRAQPTRAVRLAEGATAFGREHFNWKTNATALANFYDRIVTVPREDSHASTVAPSQ
jgi:hypothetical protein